MRSLQNSSASDEVFRAVSETLQAFPFSYQGARILSGQEEGAFGWITVNYLDDRLKQVLDASPEVQLVLRGRRKNISRALEIKSEQIK